MLCCECAAFIILAGICTRHYFFSFHLDLGVSFEFGFKVKAIKSMIFPHIVNRSVSSNYSIIKSKLTTNLYNNNITLCTHR